MVFFLSLLQNSKSAFHISCLVLPFLSLSLSQNNPTQQLAIKSHTDFDSYEQKKGCNRGGGRRRRRARSRTCGKVAVLLASSMETVGNDMMQTVCTNSRTYARASSYAHAITSVYRYNSRVVEPSFSNLAELELNTFFCALFKVVILRKILLGGGRKTHF